MADYDLVQAAVAKLRAVPAVATPLTTAPNPARIFGIRVPPDALFPRCYVRRRKGPNEMRSGTLGALRDHRGLLDVLFSTTTTATPDPEQLIETLDAAAFATLEMGIALPGLVYCRLVAAIPTYDQTDQQVVYLTGGSTYEFYRQYG